MPMAQLIIRLAIRKQENALASLSFLVLIAISAMKVTTNFPLANHASVMDLPGIAMILAFALTVKKD